ncbi:MAG: GWxTD domain-containing protein [Bryobacteraceae bacterium]|jgi:GWxTD domain-containing protein
MRLDLWLAAPLAHALGRALAHFLWQGALLAAVLRAALFLGAQRSSRWRHQAATACLLVLPLVFGVTVALSLEAGHAGAVLPPAAPRMVFNPVIAQGAPAVPVDRLAWLAQLWMGGVILFYAFRLAGWVRVDRMRRRGVCAAPPEWQQRLRTLAAAVRISQPVVLLESCLAGVPLAIGYWRPVILMPLGALAGLSAEQVEAILIHELAHIRRADYLVSLAQSLIEGLFFFHPAVWWISALVRAEREYACDDVVVALRPDARAYAAALTKLEQSRWPAIQPATAANGGNLVRRIRRLLREPAPARVPSTRASALAGALVLLAAVAIALGVWPPARSLAQEPAAAAPAAGKQEPANGIEPARRNIEEEKRLADKQKELQEAEQTVEKAQELLRRNAAEIDRAVQSAGRHPRELAQAQEQLRQAEAALKQLEAAQAEESQKLLDQQRRATVLRQLAAQQAAKSQELLQQQERALQQAAKQLQDLSNGKFDEAFRQQQQQLARADLALQQARAANGDKSLEELEKQLQQTQKDLERLSESWGQAHDSLRAQAQPPEMPRPQATTESGSAYQKWLDEDVAYIVTDRERRDFVALKTGVEREQFIEKFWQRRDPALGHWPNAFKQEYYRRIAYANGHFASSVPGWKTDRGRMYIVYGPPDEIEDQRSETPPRQAWLYHHIEGLGVGVVIEFADPGSTGDFHMTAAPASHGSYWQLMVVSPEAAQAVVQSLRAKGFPALAWSLDDGKEAYRRITGAPPMGIQVTSGSRHVLVGPYPDEASLAKAKAALEAAGYHPVRAQ